MKIFCHRKHDEEEREEIRAELERWYKSKLLEEKHLIINNVYDKLVSVGSKIGVAVKVETNNSGAIKIIIAEMESAISDKIIGEAKRELLKFL